MNETQNTKPRISASEAGKRGGKSRSAAKLVACRRNGFQKAETKPTLAPTLIALQEPK
jgi:hypothetical protein